MIDQKLNIKALTNSYRCKYVYVNAEASAIKIKDLRSPNYPWPIVNKERWKMTSLSVTRVPNPTKLRLRRSCCASTAFARRYPYRDGRPMCEGKNSVRQWGMWWRIEVLKGLSVCCLSGGI